MLVDSPETVHYRSASRMAAPDAAGLAAAAVATAEAGLAPEGGARERSRRRGRREGQRMEVLLRGVFRAGVIRAGLACSNVVFTRLQCDTRREFAAAARAFNDETIVAAPQQPEEFLDQLQRHSQECMSLQACAAHAAGSADAWTDLLT